MRRGQEPWRAGLPIFWLLPAAGALRACQFTELHLPSAFPTRSRTTASSVAAAVQGSDCWWVACAGDVANDGRDELDGDWGRQSDAAGGRSRSWAMGSGSHDAEWAAPGTGESPTPHGSSTAWDGWTCKALHPREWVESPHHELAALERVKAYAAVLVVLVSGLSGVAALRLWATAVASTQTPNLSTNLVAKTYREDERERLEAKALIVEGQPPSNLSLGTLLSLPLSAPPP